MTREEKLNKRRDAGKTYSYKPNPYEQGTDEWRKENRIRASKNISRKTPYAKWTSDMAKLENQLAKERAERAEKIKNKKAARA